ncbi:hypothetical protein BJF84_11235 [Rhodococcus sp. CUA-806]|jgi:hypothetical protein|nr:hypothetical protein BJF84_11235 [Rhodococcus sp. CUA-806]
MRWIESFLGVLVGSVICFFAFILIAPANLCADREPSYASSATLNSSRAPLPLPNARCTIEWAETGERSTTFVVDWTATLLLVLGITVMAISLLVFRSGRPSNAQHEDRGTRYPD